MRFTLVIFNTYKFFTEPLAYAELAPSFLMPKKKETLNIKVLKFSGLLKEFFFTSPQLKITLFQTVFLQLALMPFVNKIIGNRSNQLIKRKSDATTY